MSDPTQLLAVVAGCAALATGVLWQVWRRRGMRSEAGRLVAEQAVVFANREIDRLVAALGGVLGGVVVLDEQQRIVACNPAAQELAGLPPNGGRGRALTDLVPWPQLHDALALLRAAGNAPGADPGREFALHEAGGEAARSLVVRCRPLAGLGYVVAIDDQSRLKRLESLRRDFVANVSHELKTPLAAIQGFVETLLDDPEMVPATRQRFLEKIGRQSQRLTTLVADLLTLSRLDEPKSLSDGAEPCDMVAVVREAVRDLAPLAEKRRLRLGHGLPSLPVTLRADREALRQVVGNLVDNAIKYTPEGGSVSVRLSVAGSEAVLEVEDTGIGLSTEDQERVFERFYRVDRARSRELGGTGLGLSIVKNTVRGLGGDVGVRSLIGHGSTFWVRLPMSTPPPTDRSS